MAEEIDTTEIDIEPQMTTSPKTTTITTSSSVVKLKKPLLNQLNKMEPAELRHLVADMQSKLDQVEDTNVDLRVQLANAVEERDILKKKADQQKGDGADEAELKHIYDQLLYKDTRIMELNQIIMERERRIIDLQEAFSEQGQVARSKQLAVLLLGKRLQELDMPPRECKDVGTTTDDNGGGAAGARAGGGGSRWAMSTKRDGGSLSQARSLHRNASPGRAIPQLLRAGGGSPPPLDPTGEDGCSSYTTTTTTTITENHHQTAMMSLGGADASASAPWRKKKGVDGGVRKKVTFVGTDNDNVDGTPTGAPLAQQLVMGQQPRHHQHVDGMVRRIGTPPPIVDDKGSSPKNGDSAAADFDEILAENEQLRRTIADMEKQQQEHQQKQQQANINHNSNNGNAVGESVPSSVLILKAKAAAQAKIHELEAALVQKQRHAESERAELQAAIDQLNESREWALAENGKLSQQLEAAKQKCDDLHGELDASLETSAIFRRRLDENAARMDTLCTELYQSRAQTQQALDDKNIMGAEVERLKDAIFAQDEFIGMLEGDLLVYEAHVGILRDSLGATKREERQHIKSKAFSAKLNALEMEKREIAKRNNDEKLRAKALAVKVRYLEEERDELNARLRHYEREYGFSRDQPLEQQKRSVAAATESPLLSSSTVLNLDDDSSPIDSSSPTNVATDADRDHSTDGRALSITDDHLAEQHQPTRQQNDADDDDAAALAEQLQLHAQQIEAIQALKREADQQVQQLGLELANIRQSVHKFINAIANRPIPAPFNQFLLPFITNGDNDGTDCADAMSHLDTVERLLDELLHNNGTLTEVRAALEHQMEQSKQQIEREQAAHAVQEQKLHEEVDQMRVQLQQCQDQIDVAQCRIDNLTRTEAEMARELGTRQRELSSANAELGACREEKRQLEEQRAELCAQIYALDGTKTTLSAELQQANTTNATLSNTLSSEQQRLNRLISLLTEIVDRFRSSHGTNNDGTTATTSTATALLYRSESLDNLMRRIEAKTETTTTTALMTPKAHKDNESVHQQTTGLSFADVQSTVICPADIPTTGADQHGHQHLRQHKANKNETIDKLMMMTTATTTDVSVFTKHVAVQASFKQIENGTQTKSLDELNEPLLLQISQEHANDVQQKVALYMQQIEQMQQQLHYVQHNAEHQQAEDMARRECLEQQLIESGARAECLAAEIEQLEQELTVVRAELSQTALKLEEEELAHQAQREANSELESEISTLRAANGQLIERISEQSATVAVVEESTRNTVSQLLSNVDPEFGPPSIEQQQQQQKCLMLDVGTQLSADDFPSAITLSTSAVTTAIDDPNSGNGDRDHVDQADQQQRQLLLECINDRQQFEHELSQNVQQLLTLKSELENSVDVLRAEIWALNDEMKKKFEERDTLSKRLHSADSQLATLRAENAQLVAKLRDTEQKMTVLNETVEKHGEMRTQLENANQRIEQLMSEKEEEMLRMNETVDALNARIAELQAANEAFSLEIQGLTKRAQRLQSSLLEAKNLLCSWRTDLHSLRAQQQNFITQSNCSIDSVRKMAAQVVEQAKAARLVTKSRDVEALVRENQQLIHTNAQLQHELEQYNNGSNIEEDEGESTQLTKDEECDGNAQQMVQTEKCEDGGGDAWGWNEQEEGGGDESDDQDKSELQIDQKTIQHSDQVDQFEDEKVSDAWAKDEQKERGGEERSDQKKPEQQADMKKTQLEDQVYQFEDEKIGDAWARDEQEQGGGGGGDESDDQEKTEQQTDQKTIQDEDQADQFEDEKVGDAWDWDEQEEGAGEEQSDQETEQQTDQKKIQRENEVDRFEDEKVGDAWAWDEQEEGRGEERSNQEKPEQQTDLKKQEKQTVPRERTAASEPNKSLFDNLVDWAWGDK